jgi:hypothetical protein
MAAAARFAEELNLEFTVNGECTRVNSVNTSECSEVMRSKRLMSEGKTSEVELDMNELQEFQLMAMRPFVKDTLLLIVSKLETALNSKGPKVEKTEEQGRRWSDVVVER